MHLYRVGIDIWPQAFLSRVGQFKVGVDLVNEGKSGPSVELAGSILAGVHGTVPYISWIGEVICSAWVILFKTVASIVEFCACVAAVADMISFNSVVEDLNQVR